MNGCGLEYLRSDREWVRLPPLAPIAPFMYTRPAPHDWEFIPPNYRRCRRCGCTESDAEVSA